MSENHKPRTWLIAIGAVVGLLVIAFLGYSVYTLNQRLDQVLREGRLSISSGNPSKEPLPATPNFPKVAPDSTSNPLLQPDPFFSSPFDPGTWDPFREMAELQERMEQMFNEAFQRFHMSPRFGDLVRDLDFNPSVDLSEDNTHYTIRLDIPGADTANLNVKLEGRTLTISGTREKDAEEQLPGRTLRRERRIGQFQRTITLPGPVKQGSLNTQYKDGVLTITVEKAPSS